MRDQHVDSKQVGELDLFCKEDIKYMSTLTEAGVTCEFHLIPHIPHGAEGVAPQADYAQVSCGRISPMPETDDITVRPLRHWADL